jgi:Putative oxidoreductase C terminal domain
MANYFDIDTLGDLSRYIGGNIVFPTISAVAVEHFDGPGRLVACPFDESQISENERIPRVTSAIW